MLDGEASGRNTTYGDCILDSGFATGKAQGGYGYAYGSDRAYCIQEEGSGKITFNESYYGGYGYGEADGYCSLGGIYKEME